MTKAKPFPATVKPDLTGKGPEDTISRAELVALVAAIVFPDSLDSATRRHRISSKVTTDAKGGSLNGMDAKLRRGENGHFRLGDVSDWATREWPGLFYHLPMRPRIATMSATMSSGLFSGQAHVGALSLDEARTEIDALIQRIVTLETSLAMAQDQLRRDAPDAQKWRTANFRRTKAYRKLIAE